MAHALANLRSCVQEFQLQDHEETTSNIHKRWCMWVENLEYCFTFEGLDTVPTEDGAVSPEVKKKAALLALGGHQLRELYNTLEDTGTTYTEAKRKIEEHFKGSKNLTAERYKFFCMRPLSTQETHDQWVTRLKTKARDCEFDQMNMKEAIKLVVTLHTPIPKLQTAVIRDDMTFEQMMKLAQSMELAHREVSYMKANTMEPHNTHSAENIDLNKLAHYADQQGMRLAPKKPANKSTKMVELCRYCGETTPHKGSCKARGATCNNCGKKNHFSRVCESKKVNLLIAQPGPQGGSFYEYGATEIKLDAVKEKLRTTCENYPSTVIEVNIDNTRITMQVDSGADANVIPWNVYEEHLKHIPLRSTKAKLQPYNSVTLPIKGAFEAQITANNNNNVQATFYVTEGAAAQSLMGKYTAFDLDVLAINVNHLDNQQTVKQVHTKVQHLDYREMAKHLTPIETSVELEKQLEVTTHNQEQKVDAIMHHFDVVFNGIGKHKYRQVHLHIDETVCPVVQAQRRIPFAHREKLETLLQELEKEDVIERVEGPTDWVSNIVITPKADPSQIRMSIDMTTANKAIQRTRHVIPTIEELRYRMNGACHFSKLDMNHGYNQFEIDDSSRYVTVFYTHKGLRQFKRLNFGTNSAAEVFHDEMTNTLADIQQAANIYDDIIVFGRTQREHDLTLIQVLQRLADCGLTLGRSKCQLNVTSVKFFGLIFSASGISPDPAKVTALDAMTAPSNATEVRSFLGMTNFSCTFIPGYANITAPLRQLTCKGQVFEWTDECNTAYNKLKEVLKQHTTMAYFDPCKDTKLIVDGSKKDGLASILAQRDPQDNIFKPIRYDSRATTPTERNYSQLEIESLALVFGTMKNHIYLYGLPQYTASTDHQPLLALYKQTKQDMPARILRHKLKLQGYNFQLIHEPGSVNPSDYLSRHPQQKQAPSQQESEFPLYLVTNAVMRSDSAITTDMIVQATLEDPTLQSLAIAVRQGYIDKRQKELQPYKAIFKEISVDDSGIILRGDRIIIPSQLQQKTVQLAHEGHQGIVKCKQLIRSTMWFPGIDAMVEASVAFCNPCQAATDTKQQEPMKASSLPEQPWIKLNTDLFGPIEGGNEYLLVVQDMYSRYPAVEVVHATSAQSVLPAMDRIFALFGIPEYLGSDNGPPYSSTTFASYAKYMGFKHGPKIPLAPWTNGMVENFMHNLKKLLQTSLQEHLNWRHELQRLLRAYRGTPHTVTGRSPAEVLFNGRQYRTRLPAVRRAERPKFHTEISAKQEARQTSMKKYADRKAYVAESELQVGDWVMYRQKQQKKSDTPYCGTPHRIIKKVGGRVTAEWDRHVITRHSTFFKKIPNHPGKERSQKLFTKSTSVADCDIPPLTCERDADKDAVTSEDESMQTVEYEVEEDWNNLDQEIAMEQVRRSTRERMKPSKLTEYEVDLPESLK